MLRLRGRARAGRTLRVRGWPAAIALGRVAAVGCGRPCGGRCRSGRRLRGLLQEPPEQQAATARVASVEPEDPLIEVGGHVLWADGAVQGAHDQRFISEKTRCTPGSASCAGRPEALTEVALRV